MPTLIVFFQVCMSSMTIIIQDYEVGPVCCHLFPLMIIAIVIGGRRPFPDALFSWLVDYGFEFQQRFVV